MLGIDAEIAQHPLILTTTWYLSSKIENSEDRMALKIKEEVTKQLKVGFIKLVHQAEWVANVMPVPKKDEKVRTCVDFRDVNKECPKDDFPFPHIDLFSR